MPEEEVRWHYRFRNFCRALRRLQDALEEGAEALNELEQEGVIQRFKYTFELAWNTLKDRLEYDGPNRRTSTWHPWHPGPASARAPLTRPG